LQLDDIMDLAVDALTTGDIDDAVRIHLEAFPNFFLTFLGPRFLREFYGSFTWDPMGVGFVAKDPASNCLLGVVVGPTNPEGYFRRLLKKRWWAFCIAAAGAVVRHPGLIPRLARAVFFRGNPPADMPRALLCSIAVSPQAQGRGIGEALMQAWVKEVQSRGTRGCFLTTDAHDNDKVNRFYQRLGWRLESTFVTPEGRLMNRYTFDLPAGEIR